jgi:hypothetical protein
MWRQWIVPALLAWAAAFPARAADLAQTGPQASAAQIIAARNASDAPVLTITFDVSGGNHAAPATLSIDLAPDYMFIRGQDLRAVYDYKLRRVIQLDEAQHRFSNGSLYATADFRLAETYNRRMQRGMFAAIKLQQATDLFDPYWVQSELHVMDPADPAPAADMREASDGVHFTYKSGEVASYALSEDKLSDQEKAGFNHLLQERTTLHPSIISALLSSGRIPQRLSFALPPIRKQTPEVWMLRSVSRASASYPLTTGYAAGPTAANTKGPASELAAVLPLMLDAVAGRAGNGPKTVAQYRELMDDALQKKAGLQAMLLAFEANEQYGEQSLACAGGEVPPCHSLKDIVAQSQGDPRVGDLIRSLQIERTSPDQAIALRQQLRRDDVTDGYVIDGFVGNTLSATGHKDQALPLLIGEVRGDPYVAGYYKDLGDLLRQSFEPDLAWLCYDLGRALPGGSSAPIINVMNGYEAQIALRLPQFF